MIVLLGSRKEERIQEGAGVFHLHLDGPSTSSRREDAGDRWERAPSREEGRDALEPSKEPVDAEH
jgi:hypothetical protein